MKIAPPKKHASLASAKRQQLFNIEIRDTERRSPPKKQLLFNIEIRDTERRSPPLAPKLSPPLPPKTHARRPEPPHSAPPKRSPPKRSPPKSPPKSHVRQRSPPRSPPKTHVRQRKVFEITDTLTKEQIIEQKMEQNKKMNAKFIEYIRNRNAGTLQPFEKEEVPAFDQLEILLDKWKKEYEKEHKTKTTNKIAK